MSISLLLTTNRGLHMGTHVSLMRAYRELGWDHTVITDGGLDRARGMLVSNWFRTTRDDAFIMVDDDMVFTPEQLQQLLDADRDIVSAVYPTRHAEALTGMPLHPEEDHQAFSIGGLLELQTTGMGCVFVRRYVIEAMITVCEACDDGMGQWFWPLFLPMVRNRKYYGEDAAFSMHALEAGFRLWLHTGVRTIHLCNDMPVHVDNLPFIRQANSAVVVRP